MAATVVVNFMTAVHASSSGMSIAFPDVCKTPAPPAPSPIPIPYPNIAQSSDTSKEVKKVKLDGAKVMGKGSVLKMSSGDEAGSAQGLVSSKIKGKAEFANYSFDVKVGGKNACRLADPMKQNLGSSPNTMGPAELQAPNMVGGAQAKACERTNEKEEEKEENKPDPNWAGSGVLGKHQSAFSEISTKFGVVIMIRGSNPACEKWIAQNHRPKPHDVLNGKTMSAKNADWVLHWYYSKMDQKLDEEAEAVRGKLDGMLFVAGKLVYANLTAMHGIVVLTSGIHKGMPLLAHKDRGAFESQAGVDYHGKWITGDYDLADIMYNRGGCVRPDQGNGATFGRIKKELNTTMGWDGIQHGPQAQWVDESLGVDMPGELKKWLNSSDSAVPGVTIAPGRTPLPIVDKDQVIVYPGGAIKISSGEGAKDALECMGCKDPGQTV